MANIAIIGAGMMGSSMSFPARDNGHTVHLVGTPLDREIIDTLKECGIHPKHHKKLPEGVKYFQVDEMREVLKGADLLICGVSSFGVSWFVENVLPIIPDSLPVLSVTKGLEDQPDGTLLSIPHAMAKKMMGRKLSISAIGGPCTSYELADHYPTYVAFCGENFSLLEKYRNMLKTQYYHISLSTDVAGVECAVALKNAYAVAVSLSIGLAEKQDREGCREHYNPQAALFGQSVREMMQLIKMMGGGEENIVYGAGDLYVTIFGGRSRRLGKLLGRGLTIQEALQELNGVTLESTAIATCVARALRKLEVAGKAKTSDFPLLMHLDAILNQNTPVNIPWESFAVDVK